MKLTQHHRRLPAARHPLEVDNRGAGHVVNAAAAHFEAIAEVEIFAIHEKVLVEEARRRHRLARQAHGGRGTGIDLPRLVWIFKRQVVARQPPAPGKQSAESKQSGGRDPR